MPRYRTTTPVFVAPDLIPAGVIIDYDGLPSITMEPLDDEARAAIDKLLQEKPHAAVKPLDELTSVGGQPGEKATATVVAKAPKDEVVKVGTLAQPGAAQPGLSEGGKALDAK